MVCACILCPEHPKPGFEPATPGLLSQPKHIFWVLNKTVTDGSLEHLKQLLKLMGNRNYL